MQARRDLACRKQSGDGAGAGFRVDPDPAHGVVNRRRHFHGLAGDVDFGQLQELLVHRGELLFDVVGLAVRDVEENAAVWRASPSVDLGVDRPGDDVP